MEEKNAMNVIKQKKMIFSALLHSKHFFSSRLTPNEIFDLLSEPLTSDSEGDDDIVDVIFEPPTETAFAQSDEDSDLSDAEATQDINSIQFS